MAARPKPIVLTSEEIERFRTQYCVPVRRKPVTAAETPQVIATVVVPKIVTQHKFYGDPYSPARIEASKRKAFLTEEQVAMIRRRAAEGESAGVIAKDLGCGQAIVYKAAVGMTFKYLHNAVERFQSTVHLQGSKHKERGLIRHEYTEEEVAKIHKAFEEGKSAFATSKELKFPLSTLKKRHNWWKARRAENARLALVKSE